jgi:hypothetical protein
MKICHVFSSSRLVLKLLIILLMPEDTSKSPALDRFCKYLSPRNPNISASCLQFFQKYTHIFVIVLDYHWTTVLPTKFIKKKKKIERERESFTDHEPSENINMNCLVQLLSSFLLWYFIIISKIISKTKNIKDAKTIITSSQWGTIKK